MTRLSLSSLLLAFLGGCASSPENATPAATAPASPTAAPGTLAYDRDVFTALLEDHHKIRRSVEELPDGIRSTTESDDPAVAAHIRDHVFAMKARVETGRRLRQWDPIYVAIFDAADAIVITVEPTARGAIVTETSADASIAALIKSHAKVVSGFVSHGFEESARAHDAHTKPAQ